MTELLEPKKFLLLKSSEYTREGRHDLEGRFIGIKKFNDPPEIMLDCSEACVAMLNPKQAKWLVGEIEDWLRRVGKFD